MSVLRVSTEVFLTGLCQTLGVSKCSLVLEDSHGKSFAQKTQMLL